MAQWQQHILQVVDFLLQHPQSLYEYWAIVVLALFAGLWSFNKIADAFSVLNLSGGTVLSCFLVGYGLIIVAVVAGRIYMPEIFLKNSLVLLMFAVGAVVSVVVAVPLMMRIVQGGYFVLLFTWTVSAIAALSVILLCSAGFDAFRATSKGFNKGKYHSDEISRFLNR